MKWDWKVAVAATGSVASIVSLAVSNDARNLARAIARWVWTDHPHFLVAALAVVIAALLVGRSRAVRSSGTQQDEQGRLADIQLFRALTELLPPDGETMFFLRGQDFAARFRWEPMKAVRIFVHDWADASHEFLDPIIEERKRALRLAADELVSEAAARTFPVEHDRRSPNPRQEVPREWRDSNDETLRRQYEEVTQSLNKKADALVEAYEDLVRTARSRLRT